MIDTGTTGSAAVLAAALALGFGLAEAPAQAQEKAPQKMTFSYVDGTDVVSIEVDGDDLVILLNGAEMPEKRYQRHGNVVRCRDAHGRPVAVLNVYGTTGMLQTLPRQPHRLRLGVTLNPPSSALAGHLGLDAEDTLFISQVVDGKAGDKAGLRKHDIITHIEGRRPATKKRLGNVLKKKEPGQTVVLRVVRRGTPRDIDVVLEAEQQEWLSVLGYDALVTTSLGLDYTTLNAIEAPTLQYLSDVQIEDPKFVPYLFQTDQVATFGFKPWTSAVEEPAKKGDGGDRKLSEQLSELEKRLSSLEKMLEKALDRLNRRVK